MLSTGKTTAFARNRHTSTFRDGKELKSLVTDIGSREPVLTKELDAHLVFLSGIVLHRNVYGV